MERLKTSVSGVEASFMVMLQDSAPPLELELLNYIQPELGAETTALWRARPLTSAQLDVTQK